MGAAFVRGSSLEQTNLRECEWHFMFGDRNATLARNVGRRAGGDVYRVDANRSV
jgi:hypothetical protein